MWDRGPAWCKVSGDRGPSRTAPLAMVLNHCLVGNVAPSPWDPGVPIQSLLGSTVWESRRKRENQKESRRKRQRERKRQR